jgi:hypothetical protein
LYGKGAREKSEPSRFCFLFSCHFSSFLFFSHHILFSSHSLLIPFTSLLILSSYHFSFHCFFQAKKRAEQEFSQNLCNVAATTKALADDAMLKKSASSSFRNRRTIGNFATPGFKYDAGVLETLAAGFSMVENQEENVELLKQNALKMKIDLDVIGRRIQHCGEVLNLNALLLTAGKMQALTAQLVVARHVTSLLLPNNCLTNRLVEELATAIKAQQPRNLKALDLSHNRITSFDMLAPLMHPGALSSNGQMQSDNALERLILNGNRLSQKVPKP